MWHVWGRKEPKGKIQHERHRHIWDGDINIYTCIYLYILRKRIEGFALD
jgi:hypothetical protein